ncbi:MAG TPA: amidohydrolase family protein [Hanamia sp.]|nr:amidohydrolase family protein [Hanamia sp.]
MRHRKLKADFLFTGEKLLTNEKILITDLNGEIIDIIDKKDAGEEIETFKGILSPGFVNAHCHLELSHLKNKIPERTGLVDFVFKIVSERYFAEDEILAAIAKAETEMFQNGIVAVGDICNNSLTLSQKIKRNLCYYNFIETSGWHPEIASLRFERAKKVFDEFENHDLKASIVPHAPYSVSENLWSQMMPFFEGKTISIHNQETSQEDLFFMEGKGDFTKMYELMKIDNSFYTAKKIRSIESYFKNLSSANSVILVHNTFTKQPDLDFIDQQKNEHQLISFCLCPNANLYIENALPPIDLFLKNNVNIILGTDSLASNYQLNILEEIKTIVKDFPQIKTETLLKWATINGAKALQMQHAIGSLEKGKKPGVILIENTEGEKIMAESKIKRLI